MNRISFLNRGYAFKGLLAVSHENIQENPTNLVTEVSGAYSEIISNILQQNIPCGYSLESSHCNSSNEYPQYFY